MWCVERQVTEEWPLAIILDEFDRMIGKVIDDKADAANELAVVVNAGTEVKTPWPEQKP